MRTDRLLFPRKLSRRDFLGQTAGATAGLAATALPAAAVAQATATAAPVTIGSGKWTYTLDESWGRLPDGMAYGFGGAVVVDGQDRV